MMAYQTDSAKSRMPGAAFAPAARPRTRPGSGTPGVMHDFGRIRIHDAGGQTLADSSQCASGRLGKNGETGCDVGAGKPVTTIHEPPECYRPCVERHEAVHARDITSCCTRAGTAYRAAASDEARTAVEDKFAKWIKEDNEAYLECRGYTESAKCAQEYLDKNCGARKQDADTSETAPIMDEAPESSLTTPGTALAEEQVDAGTKKEAPGPEECCPKVRCYGRVSQGRADNICSDAPKTLTKCPF